MPDSSDTQRYQCPCCGFIYDESKGDPDNGFPPGTAFETLPDDYTCPDCSVRYKEDFEPCAA